MTFASHRSKHRLNRKFRKKWISIIPLIRDHRVCYLFVCFKQQVYFPLPLRWEACSPRKSAHDAAAPLRHMAPARPACSPFHCALISVRSTPRPLATFLFLKWTETGKCYLSISDWCFICYHEKIFFWRLRSFVYLWTLFSSLLLSLFVWISFSILLIFKKLLVCIV